MRHSLEAAEFGRKFLRIVERESGGEWIRSQRIYEATVREHADNAYVTYLVEGPGARRTKVPYVIADVMPEFPHIERRKDGLHQSAPVWYRTRGFEITADPDISAQGFADWRAALRDGARLLTPGLQALPEQRLVMTAIADRARRDGIGVKLAAHLPAPPWTVEINEPSEPGRENGLSAVAVGHDGRRVLLRQGRLQRNPESDRLLVGDDFRARSGLRPVAVQTPAGPAARQWYLVAELNADFAAIRDQTAAFVDACARARLADRSPTAPAPSPAELFAPDEIGGSYVTGAVAPKPPAEVRRLQGEVWQALAKRCADADIAIQKPMHSGGYEVDVELITAPQPLLIEIKTGWRAADIYSGVGQLAIYPKLMPRLAAHRRILLLNGEARPAMAAAVAACGIEIHTYSIGDGAGPPCISFSPAFLSVCGLPA